MKCKWCDHTFLRGGPERSYHRLRDHVERLHPEQLGELLKDATLEQKAVYGDWHKREEDPE